ncbi:MAG: extracellular solute-binding protein [Lachnospiraceae bacterium]|nr:extracellular solute-binding protein [Lachnospiraceae bacterium]MBR6151787.1 extracellular solute-binding protein [Lachnospiraceae bacterium]
MKNTKGIGKKNMLKKCLPWILGLGLSLGLTACGQEGESEVITLRVANWEEYIDEGEWDEEDAYEFSDGTVICPENSIVEDFEEWYYETYGQRVVVEYSTFGTNEELYNQITIGDVYDLVCPSEYMIMKMLREGMLTPYSEAFFDTRKPENYYANGVSPFIAEVYDGLTIDGQKVNQYAAGYMWGTLGLVYNPEEVTAEQASSWKLLLDKDLYRRITVKDSVRDAFFAAASIHFHDEITAREFVNQENYSEALHEYLNRTDQETVDASEEILSAIKRNVYSFETDAGKADMVTGKVVANQQWSGDAVYTMDQAEEDDLELCYSVPEESTNLWFDGWVMLSEGLGEDSRKQQVAEAFVNFVSMPENVIRNMTYIGYTSVISGGESDLVLEYVEETYGADPEEEEDELVEYDVSYFFGEDKDAVILTTEDQTRRQLYAQYPSQDVVDRSVVMECFDKEGNERMNRMWTNVRCFDLKNWFEILFQ